MKELITISLLAGLACTTTALAQANLAPNPAVAPGEPGFLPQKIALGDETHLTKFDLDFPGGMPRDLVQAIEHATGKPLNIVIPILSADVPLPPLKMRAITVPELFKALQGAGHATSRSEPRTYGKMTYNSSRFLQYDFQTFDKPPRDDSVWYFTCAMATESKGCRFWQLAPYLDTYTIDDITTAIQTGYKMLGDEAPTINFHKDTKLLIAVGDESKLALIDAVLQQLQPTAETIKPGTPPAQPGPAKAPEAQKP